MNADQKYQQATNAAWRKMKDAKESALKQFYDDMEAAWNEYQQDTMSYPQCEIPEEQR
jgi:hypothetical protein